ncbi:hypothetical protein [Methylibium sp.]|uniref:hypothetical protein n=1 Tax=Methylibium sp. TaxID=2067992 RepID=UPI003BA89A93
MSTPEHERYVWLRDGRSRYGGYCGSAPFVMNPRQSRLYAIAQFRAAELDVAIDADIFWNKVGALHDANDVVERGLLPDGASPHDFEGPYVDALELLAQRELGWDDARTALAKATGEAA